MKFAGHDARANSYLGVVNFCSTSLYYDSNIIIIVVVVIKCKNLQFIQILMAMCTQ